MYSGSTIGLVAEREETMVCWIVQLDFYDVNADAVNRGPICEEDFEYREQS